MRPAESQALQAAGLGVAGVAAVGARSDVTLLLARQRSGTNALRSVLGTHEDICCLDEVFKLSFRHADDPLTRASNYFTFLEQYCAGDITRAFPDRHEEVFLAYLAYLRGLTTKGRIVVDVKYNSTHHVTDVFREVAEPTLFPLLRHHRIGVLHVTRRNLLRSLLSGLKAWRTDRYHVENGDMPDDMSLSLPAQWTLARLQAWADEDDRVAAAFDGYAFYSRVEYTDLFPDASGAVASGALRALADWFDVPSVFTNHASFRKLSSLPLDQTIENIDELRATLRGTRFEGCLDDEPAYARPGHASPAA